MLQPPRKRPPRRHPKCLNQLSHSSPSRNQSPREFLQFVIPTFIPLRRNPSHHLPHHILAHLLYMRQPRLKRLPAPHLFINLIPCINAPQGIVRKRPLPRIETISLIDEKRSVQFFPRPSSEGGLTPVCVSCP